MASSREILAPMRRNSGMGRWLASVSAGAASLVLATLPATVRAQAVNGTPTPQFGIGGISRSTPGLDAVFIDSGEALIDWTASDSGGVFLPEGHTLRFIYDGSSPYTVLNRVTDTAVGGPLSIAGTVESSTLGQVWFYNAGGWVVGAKGVFNVGSLVLTSLPITIDPAGPGARLYGDKGEIRFGTALDPKSSVSIQSGASIRATMANSSYVALVAPRVDQAGTVAVNGSAAYVGAEAATMTINGGLFDIIVDSGTDDDVGVSHSGSTTFPANAGSTDTNRGIYLVAVPKNQAMTAVVSGRLGYDSATSASIVNGSIVLSAGHNVAGGAVVAGSGGGTNASLALSNLNVGSKGFTTDLLGSATGNITLDATAGNSSFNGSVSLEAQGNIGATIDNARSVSVEGSLSLTSTNGAKAGNVSASVAGNGGLFVTGTLDLVSSAARAILTDPSNGDALLTDSVGEDALSGNVSLTVTSGNVFAGATNVQSSATSGVGDLSTGSATAGNATIAVTQAAGAGLGVTLGNVTVSSTATDGFFSLGQSKTGGNATAGDATLAVSGGTFDSTSLTLYSNATTYAGSDGTALNASAGTVGIGFANLEAEFQTGAIGASNSASASDGGIAALGNIAVAFDNASASTDASSGEVNLTSAARGQLVTPNTVSLSLTNKAALDTLGSNINISASGDLATGTQRSGSLSVLLDGSSLAAGSLNAITSARGSDSGTNAQAGNVSAIIRNGSDVALDLVAGFDSIAVGGSGVDGGSGTGGSVSFVLADSSFAGDLGLLSRGTAGSRSEVTGTSGTGRGGTLSFAQTGKSSSLTADDVTLSTLGRGGQPAVSSRTSLIAQAGDGASGIGGTSTFSIADGTFTTTTLSVDANGEGADGLNPGGSAPGAGGLGRGGTSRLNVTGGLLSAGRIVVAASGFGGDGARAENSTDGGTGGAGTGGSASALLTGGAVRTEALLVEANGNKSFFDTDTGEMSYFGYGGYEQFGLLQPGKGGVGTGGIALVTVNGGAVSAAVPYRDIPPSVRASAIGEGGPGGYAFSNSSGTAVISGSGGDGVGGTATIRYLSGDLDAGSIGADASGLGGLTGRAVSSAEEADIAGNGGNGRGGKAAFEIAADLGQRTSLNALRSVNVRADGIGAEGEKGVAGGRGGNGTGGDAKLATSVGKTSLANVTLSAKGAGGNGGSGFIGGNGGNGGTGTGGQVQLAADGFGAQLIVQSPVLMAGGTGGLGGDGGSGTDGRDEAGNGGSGGTGRGGTISFAASNLGQVSVAGATAGSTFAALGQGGSGGLGGNSAIFFGATLGNGGSGGSGFGGTINALAASGGGLAFDGLTLSANGIGGAGGGRVSGSSSGTLSPSLGGTGGAGRGGSISLVSTDFRSSLSAASLSASADGLGGAGADGAGYTASGQSTDGSAGGNGTGGMISLLADLEGTLELAAKAGNLSISAMGLGGDGGTAQDAIGSSGAAGGNGGASGSGTGGSIQLTAGAQATASLGLFGTTTVDAGAMGGRAGGGGNGAPTFTPATVGGKGGNTGLARAGTGGTVNFVANGGSLNLAALDAKAQGITQYRNLAGSGGSGPGGIGAPGSTTDILPTGGTIGFAASDDLGGSLGQIKAGAVTTNVTSRELFVGPGVFSLAGAGGISLANSATSGDGGIRFGSFQGDASGSATVDPAIAISVTAGSIAIDTNLTLFAGGNVAFDLAGGTGLLASTVSVETFSGIAITGKGTGRISAGSINLFSFGSTAVASTGCATATCRPLEASGTLSVDAFGDFSLSGPVELAGLGTLAVYAGNNLTSDTGSRYFSNGNVEVRAGNDATIRNITGANVIAEAGAVKDGGYLYVDGLLTLGEVEGGGLFTASGTLDLNSGGTLRTLDGATFTAGSGIGLRTGNDILVGFGNTFTANAGLPSTPGGVVFAAGGQTIDYSLAPTDIATLSFGGGTMVDAGSGGVTLSGAAIDARFASFTGATFQADVLTTLAQSDTRRTDGGSLDPDCLEGAICVGNVTAAGLVSIGTGAAVPLDIRAAGTISGASVELRATGDLTFGGLESTAQLASTNDLSITSLSGGIALLGGSEVRGGTVRLSAATDLSGTGNIEATFDDIGLSIGGDIDASSIVAVRELTTATAAGIETEGTFSTPGSFRTGLLSLGSPTALFASGEIAIGALSLGGSNGRFEAGGALRVGTSSAVANLSLIAGTTASFDDLVTSGNLSISAATINGTSARAGGTLSITGTDLAADLLQSAGDLTLTITNEAALGSVASTGGAVSIDPVLLTFAAITAANDITLVGDTITGGTLDAGTSIDVTATGALTLDSANSGTAMTLRADSLGSGTLTAGTDLALVLAGDTVLTGTATSGGNAAISGQGLLATAFDVTGNLTLTLTGAAALSGPVTVGGDFSSTAASLGFGSIDAGAAAIFGGGSVTGGNVTAGGAISASLGGAATFGTLTSGLSLGIGAQSISATRLLAGQELSLFANDTISLGTGVSGLQAPVGLNDTTSITANQLTFDEIGSRGLAALTGGTITGRQIDGGGVSIDASASVDIRNATSRADLTISAPAITLDGAGIQGKITLTSSGSVDLGTASAGGAFAIAAGDLSFVRMDGSDLNIAASSLTGGATGALGSALISAVGDITIDSVTSGLAEIRAANLVANRFSANTLVIESPGTVSVGSLTAVASLSATAGDLRFDELVDSGVVTLNTGSLSGGVVDRVGRLNITATNAVVLGSARTTSGLTISARSLTAPSLESAGDLSLTIADTATLGSVTSGGAVAIDPALLTFDAITAANGIALSGGTITGGTLDAGADIDVNATGTLTLLTARAGGNLSLAGDSLSAGLLDSGRDLDLAARDRIALTDLANAGGSLTASFATLDFIELNAIGQLDLAGGSITGRGLTAGLDANIALTGGYTVTGAAFSGNLLLGAQMVSGAVIDAIGNADVTVAGRSSLFGYTAGGDLLLLAGQLSAEALSGRNVDARIAGTATVTSGLVGTGGNFALSAASLGAGTLRAGNTLSLTTTGAINITGEATAGGNLAISSASLAAPTLRADGNMNLSVTNRAEIGLANAGQTISATAASFSFENFSANDISVNAGSIDQGGLSAINAITVTATGSASIGAIFGGALTITAHDLSSSVIQSHGGNVSLSASAVASIGDVSALAGDITVNAGRLTLGSATASGQILLGAVVIDGFGRVEAGTSALVNATNAISIGEVLAGLDVSLAGGDIEAIAVNAGTTASYVGGDIRVGSTSTGTTANVAARSFSFDRLTATGDVVIQTSAGLTGGSIDTAGNLDLAVGGTARLDAASADGDIGAQFGTLTANLLAAGGLLDLTGAELSWTNANAGADATIALTGDFAGNSLISGGTIALSSRNASSSTMTASGDITLTITDTATLGIVRSTSGSVLIDPVLLTFDAISANQAISLAGGGIIGGTLDAGTSVDVTATGGLTLVSATSGTSMSLAAASLYVPTLSAGTDLAIQTSGGVEIASQVTALGTIAITADTLTAPLIEANGNVGITIAGLAEVTTLRSLGGNVSSQAGTLQFDLVSARGRVRLIGGNLSGATVTSGADTTLSATNALSVNTVTAGTSATINGNSVTANTVNAGTSTDFDGSNIRVGTTQAGTTAFVDSRNFTFDRMEAGQSVEILAFRDITGGTIDAGTTVAISARGDVALDAATAGGRITARAANLQALTVNGGAGLSLTVTNAVDLGTVDVLGAFDLTAGSLALGSSQSGLDSALGLSGNAVIGGMAAGTGASAAPAGIVVTTGGTLTTGALAASSRISLAATGAFRLDAADAGTALSLAGDTIDAGSLRAGTDITLASAGASLIGSATAQGRFLADVGALDFTQIDAADGVDIASLASVGGGDIRSGASITVAASGPIAIRDASASGGIALATSPANSIAARALVAGGAISIEGGEAVLSSIGAGGDFNATVQSLASPTIAVTGNFTVTGTGAVEIGTMAAGGSLAITSQTLTFTRMSAGSGIDLAATGNVTGGDLVATGTIRINTGSARFGYGTLDGGDIAIVAGSAAGGAIRTRTGDLTLSVGGDASLGTIDATGNVALDAQGLSFGTIRAGGTFSTTNRAMTGTAIDAGQDVAISSQGDVALSGLSGRTARISSAGIVNITGLQLAGPITVLANAVGLDAVGDLAIQSISANKGDVAVSAGGSITGSSIAALGDIDLLARNGNVEIGTLSAGYAGAFSDAVRPKGTVSSGVVGQGNIDIVASGDIVINDVADAARAFTMDAGGAIHLNGLATGATMDLISADLDIGSAGHLGETAHTDAITLRNTGQGPLRLGDNLASTASGYAISQAEFARIRSRGDLTIRANQALLVGDLAVVARSGTAEGQIGETGTLSLRSGSLASFLGALAMTNATGNTLAIDSQTGVFLDAASGSIRLTDGEVRAGTLAISGSGIAMVTRGALADIAQLTDTALITDRLGLNDGVADGRILVEADAIRLRSDREVYIQNTALGTRLDDRRGLVANSVRIGSRDGSQLDIVINGIVNGQVGVDAIEQIRFDERFTDLSSVNGCVILSANTCNKLPFEIIELRDVVEEVLKTEPADEALQIVDSFTKTSLIQLNQIAPAGFEPLIDEPVTGTGNDDLLGEGKAEGE